jgi:hypothetical protein
MRRRRRDVRWWIVAWCIAACAAITGGALRGAKEAAVALCECDDEGP